MTDAQQGNPFQFFRCTAREQFRRDLWAAIQAADEKGVPECALIEELEILARRLDGSPHVMTRLIHLQNAWNSLTGAVCNRN